MYSTPATAQCSPQTTWQCCADARLVFGHLEIEIIEFSRHLCKMNFIEDRVGLFNQAENT
jgi:hypothetical protein